MPGETPSDPQGIIGSVPNDGEEVETPARLPPIHASDFVVVGTLIVLEGLLSADNALVLALLVRHLPDDQQKKALLYGLIGAFTLRSIGIAMARFIMGLWPLCALGALYLVGLSVRHFLHRDPHDTEENVEKKGLSFWQTVVMVELTDIIFAVDSILVAVALVNDPARIWIVYTGGFIGIVLLRLAASFFISLIKKYPSLDHLAYALVGWAGVKLASTAVDIYHRAKGQHEPGLLPKPAFWIVFTLIVVIGTVYAVRHKRTAEDDADALRADEALECLEEGGFSTPPPGPPGGDTQIWAGRKTRKDPKDGGSV